MSRPLFTTARLAVRALEEGDVDALLAVYGDAEVTRFAGGPLDRDGCVRWVEVTRRNVATRGYGMCAVTQGGDGRVLGFCGLVHPGGQEEAEVKYAFLPEVWGRGLATEVVAALLAHGASAHGLATVIATVHPDNAASRRVLAKAGLVREAPRREADGSLTEVFRWTAPGG